MIVVPPKILDFECSAPVEDLPVWGVDETLKTYYPLNPTSPAVFGPHKKYWENLYTRDVFLISSDRVVYKQAAGSGPFSVFVAQGVVTDVPYFSGISGNDTTGQVYIYGHRVDGAGSQVYVVDPITALVTDLGTVGGVNRLCSGLDVDRYTNDVFVSLYHASTTPGILRQTAGSGTFDSYDVTQTYVKSVQVDSITKDLYVIGASSNIMKQTAGAGAFSLITGSDAFNSGSISFSDAFGTLVASADQNLYRKVGAGDFTEVSPSDVQFTGAFVSKRTNAVFPSIASEAYQALCSVISPQFFAQDEYCVYGDHIYLALSDSLGVAPTDATKWFDYTPVNNRRAFDGGLTSVTESGDSDLHFTFMGESVDSVGLFNVRGVQVTLRILTPSGIFYEESKTISGRNMAFLDLPDPGSIAVYAFVISAGSAGVYCGGVVGGVAQDIGRTGWGVNVELVSYSKVSLDDFGRATLNQRGRAKRVTFPVHAELSQAQDIYNIFNENDATFCMWQGDATSDFLLVYGIYKRLDLPLKQTSVLQYSFEVLGDVDTPVTEGEFTLVTPAAAITPTRAVMAEDGRTVFVWLTGPADIGADGTEGFVLTVTDGPVYPLSYVAGAGGICLVLTTAEVVTGAPLNLSYTQPGVGFVSLDSFSMFTVSSYLFLSDVEEVADAIHTLLHTTLPETMGVEIWQ